MSPRRTTFEPSIGGRLDGGGSIARLQVESPQHLGRRLLDLRNVTRYSAHVIRTFRDRATRAIFEGGDVTSKDAKRARKRLPTQLWRRARAKLDEIDAATDSRQLATPSNHLEVLSGDREGQHSIRINRQYRICFTWRESDAWDVEIVDYH